MKDKKKIVRIVAVPFLILIGVLGLFLPFLPGIPILMAAIYFLYPEKFKKWFHKVTKKR